MRAVRFILKFIDNLDGFEVKTSDFAVHFDETGASFVLDEGAKFGMKLNPSNAEFTYAKQKQSLIYHNAFEKTDLVFYDKGNGNLAYDLVLEPNANIQDVQITLEHAEGAFISERGELVIPTQAGLIHHSAPYTYQEVNGNRVEVESAFTLQNNVVGFNVGDYDKTQSLVIDPEISVTPASSSAVNFMPLAPYQYEQTTSTAIPDNGCATNNNAVVTFNVTDNFTINDLNVGLVISHTYRNDLDVTLQSPAGTLVTLFTDIGSNGSQNFDILLDSDVATNISTVGATNHNTASPFYENIRTPETATALNAFDGESSFGTWTLRVCDDTGDDVGSILRSILQFDGTAAGINVNVFTDINGNGIDDGASEAGIAGLVVTAYDAANNPTILTDNGGGNYSFVPANNDTYRVEVTGLATNLQPSTAGATTVSFLSLGETANVGVNDPSNYAPDRSAVFLATPCYVDGAYNGTNAAQDVLVMMAASQITAGVGNISPTEYFVADHDEIGSTFGVAYSESANAIFAAAFTKRHTGFGPSGTGAIYRINLNGTTAPIASTGVSTFMDLNALFGANTTGTDPHPIGSDFNRDPNAYDAVGKIGLGGLALSEDENTLWTINLADRRLYEMPLGGTRANPSAPSAGNISRWPSSGDMTDLPGLPGSAADRDINVRPFAVKCYGGNIYVGLVYTAESTVAYNQNASTVSNTGDRSQMQGFIYKFDPSTDAFTKVLEFDFDYARGQAIDFCSNNAQAEFFPWSPVYDKTTFETAVQGNSGGSGTGASALAPERAYPQPWITDIEFDRYGKMIIGVRDRFADQHGYKKLPPSASGADPNTIFNADGAGDVLVASLNTLDNTTYVIENNSSNGTNGATFGPTTGINKGEGPGNGEFFYDDRYRPANASADGPGIANCAPDVNDQDPILEPAKQQGHDEVSLGGLFYLPGTNNILVSVYDPIDNFDDFNQGGILDLSVVNGSRQGASLIYATQDFNPGTGDNTATFGKGNGLGDVAGVSSRLNAPIEIGNRLWKDDNGNGRQDANESGINGVLVELYKETSPNTFIKVAETTTAADAVEGDGAFKFTNRSRANLVEWRNKSACQYELRN
ncbi:MAG: hypothetical protein HC892_09780 [Saprospiraceae bacterium]|nr:hypothetical protein [Saprospiraceae bacterium]